MKPKYKTAFISGAASGVGLALAKYLAAEEVDLFLTDINAEGLSQAAKELREKFSVKIHAQVLDVADKEAFAQTAEEAIKALGQVDLVFNNAGVALTQLVEDMPLENFEWLMGINFWGVIYGCNAFLPSMRAQGSGHIINISSLFGLVGVPGQSAYCAAKHAVKGFSESLYYELHHSGVQVHCVHPGGVATGIVKHGRHHTDLGGAVDKESMQEMFESLAITTPDQAAAIIMKGVKKSKFKIIVGGDARKIDFVQRHFPFLWRLLFLRRNKRLISGQAANDGEAEHTNSNSANNLTT